MKTILTSVILIAVCYFTVHSQSFIIKGIVVDKEKIALPGVAVVIKGTKKGTITDIDGKFTIQSSIEKCTLFFSYIGYKTKEINILDTAFLTINLDEESIMLDEMVIRGYGTVKRRDCTASMSVVKHKGKTIYGSRSEFSTKENTEIKSGLLTSGEVNDFSKWELWKDITSNELQQYQKEWKIKPFKRYTVQITTKNNFPIINAYVKLIENKSKIIWVTKSDNTGKAELWYNPYDSDTTNIEEKLSIQVEFNGNKYSIISVKKFHDGINYLEIPENYNVSNEVDIAFVVDATGSMADEINYLKAELKNIIATVKDTIKDINLNLASVFYRDYGDEYVTKISNFSSNIDITDYFIHNNYADGGGDGPEAVEEALKITVDSLNWNNNARTRIVFLVLDAPPHQNINIINKIKDYIYKASLKGIRIVPITCSGIDKSTEYLMRSIALLTNGTYTFLTDDSGIGGSHIKPSTDEYKVELLNELILRLIYQFSHVSKVTEQFTNNNNNNEKSIVYNAISTKENIDSSENNYKNTKKIEKSIRWKYFPNPTNGIINIESEIPMKELFICDISGKIVDRYTNLKFTNFQIDLSKLSNGIYFICFEYETDKWLKGKVILYH